jgi:hypothetical protein
MSRDRYTAGIEKRIHVKSCEERGEIADSQAARIELLKRVKSGELTLDEMQAELKSIKRDAKKNGQKTKAKAWSEG